jgi:hypothetical protein
MSARETVQKAMDELRDQHHPNAKAVGSLLHRLKQGGFKPVSVYDGGEIVQATKSALLSVDESSLYIEKNKEWYKLFIVLGNDNDEIVADYTYKETPTAEELEQILNDFADYWAED